MTKCYIIKGTFEEPNNDKYCVKQFQLIKKYDDNIINNEIDMIYDENTNSHILYLHAHPINHSQKNFFYDLLKVSNNEQHPDDLNKIRNMENYGYIYKINSVCVINYENYENDIFECNMISSSANKLNIINNSNRKIKIFGWMDEYYHDDTENICKYVLKNFTYEIPLNLSKYENYKNGYLHYENSNVFLKKDELLNILNLYDIKNDNYSNNFNCDKLSTHIGPFGSLPNSMFHYITCVEIC
jgi:hypothetical protein